jgi:acetylornithine deacetylase
MDVFELTRRLIAIPSPSGEEEAVARFLADYLERAGFRVELQQAADRRPNVYARHGDPDVVLSTHLDTVPPDLELREDDTFIYGRGACDAKGIAAAMVKAAERLVSEGRTDIGLLFVVGEEAGSAGAHAANRIPNRSRYLIDGEPTDSRLAIGMKGALRLMIRAAGRAAHSAYPHRGESAIDKLLHVLRDIRALDLPADDVLGETTLNVGVIAGGVAANVIPPSAEALLLFRVVRQADELYDMVKEAVGDRATVDREYSSDAMFLQRLDGFDTTVVAFTADVSILTNWGKPLLFGPGSILDAHTSHEKISKRELEAAVGLYADMVHRLTPAGGHAVEQGAT